MRLSVNLLPAALLVALPLSAACRGWGLARVCLHLVLIGLLRQFLVLRPVFGQAEGKEGTTLVLETHPLSHFCEKVRWCLDYAGIEYKEEMDLGSLGILLMGRRIPTLKVPGCGITIQNSSDILRYLYGKHAGRDARVAAFLEPTEESLRLERLLDGLGDEVKFFTYPILFRHRDAANLLDRLLGMEQKDIPLWQKLLFKALMPVLQSSILKRNSINEATATQKKLATAEKLKELEELLSDGREYLLGGDAPTYVDFHLASMLGGGGHRGYGGRAVAAETRLDWEAEMEPELVAEFNRIYDPESSVVKFAKKMYDRHRFDQLAKK